MRDWVDELLEPCPAVTVDHEGVDHRCVFEPDHAEEMHLAIHRVGGVAMRIQWKDHSRYMELDEPPTMGEC